MKAIFFQIDLEFHLNFCFLLCITPTSSWLTYSCISSLLSVCCNLCSLYTYELYPPFYRVRRNLNLTISSSRLSDSTNVFLEDAADTTDEGSQAVTPPPLTAPVTSSSQSQFMLSVSSTAPSSTSISDLINKQQQSSMRSVGSSINNSSQSRGAPRDTRSRDRLARSSLSELKELMEEGEKRGIFGQQRLPARILDSIVHHNLKLYSDS